jgi:hypothetical protein
MSWPRCSNGTTERLLDYAQCFDCEFANFQEHRYFCPSLFHIAFKMGKVKLIKLRNKQHNYVKYPTYILDLNLNIKYSLAPFQQSSLRKCTL